MMPPLNEITNPIHSARLQNGARLFKYMRFHPGLNVYIEVFQLTAVTMSDFAVWFMFLIVWCSIVIYGTGAMLGANVDFASFSDTLNRIALLTFGFYDYDGMYNGGIGLGFGTAVMSMWFWLMVILSYMFAQNIILAIVANAYDAASERASTRNSKIFLVSCYEHLRWVFYSRTTKAVSEGTPEYGKYRLLSKPDMEGLYHYFQSSLTLEPGADSWLWDGGKAISEANDEVGLWPPTEKLPTVRDFLEIELTEDKLMAIINHVSKCKKLRAARSADFCWSKWCCLTNPGLVSYDGSQKYDNRDSNYGNRFHFDEDSIPLAKAICGIFGKRTDVKGRSGSMFNKQKTIVNGVRKTQNDVSEMKMRLGKIETTLATLVHEMQGKQRASSSQESRPRKPTRFEIDGTSGT